MRAKQIGQKAPRATNGHHDAKPKTTNANGAKLPALVQQPREFSDLVRPGSKKWLDSRNKPLSIR